MVDSAGSDVGLEALDLAALPAGGELQPGMELRMDASCGPDMPCQEAGMTFRQDFVLTGATAAADGLRAAASAEAASLATRAAPGSISGMGSAVPNAGLEKQAMGKSRLATVSTSGSTAVLNDDGLSGPTYLCRAASPTTTARKVALPPENMLADSSEPDRSPSQASGISAVQILNDSDTPRSALLTASVATAADDTLGGMPETRPHTLGQGAASSELPGLGSAEGQVAALLGNEDHSSLELARNARSLASKAAAAPLSVDHPLVRRTALELSRRATIEKSTLQARTQCSPSLRSVPLKCSEFPQVQWA
jgi:hypothetical protein